MDARSQTNRQLWAVIFFGCSLVSMANAQLDAHKPFNGVSRPIRVSIQIPEQFSGEPTISLLRAGNSFADAQTKPVEAGNADLAGLFPILWTTEHPAVMYAQLSVDGQTVGPPLVLEPMLSPVRARNGFEDSLVTAAESRNDNVLLQLVRLPINSRDDRKQTVRLDEDTIRVFSGYRVYEKRDVIMVTPFGELRIATRPEHAPRIAHTFVTLAEGGFYDGVIFHRVIPDDGRGRPFVIQAGDPTGLGHGGAGFLLDYEPSRLAHDFGVLSAARHPHDPNSNGSQFFICLTRENCQHLDGQYTAFGKIIDGMDVVETIGKAGAGGAGAAPAMKKLTRV